MGVFTAWGSAALLQTIRDAKAHRAPLPSEYVASGMLFAALALLNQAAPPVGSWISWGFLIALVLQAGGPAAVVNGAQFKGPAAVATPPVAGQQPTGPATGGRKK